MPSAAMVRLMDGMQSWSQLRSASTIPRVAAVTLTCLLVAEVVNLAHNLGFDAPQSSSALEFSRTRPAGTGRKSPSGSEIAAILAANLFGATAAAAESLNGESADLKLVGVFAYKDPRMGFAFLAGVTDRVVMLRAGEVAPDGTVLREAYFDHVVVERGDHRFNIGLAKPELLTSFYSMPLPPDPEIIVAGNVYTPPGIPVGLSFGSQLAMEREAHPPDLSQVRPPGVLPPDQLEPAARPTTR